MKKICSFLLITCLHLGVKAQEVNLKNFEKSYIAQDYKNPFKKAKKICFLGVNLGIRTQSFTSKNQKLLFHF